MTDTTARRSSHARQRQRPWRRCAPESADPRLPRLLARSLDDAAALRMATTLAPGEVFLGAGAPWYLTLFGRDSIWAARLLLPFGWQLAAGTLRALAAFQGSESTRHTGEAPGKIPHELGRPGAAAHADDLPRCTTARSTRRRCGSACCTTRGGGACRRAGGPGTAARLRAALAWMRRLR